jgi:class 3 adenylate cyclase
MSALTRDHPLRERLWAQRMIALYRAGRQADALRAYQELRTHLAEELGLEPGAELRRLEGAILRHAPELDWGPPGGVAAAAAPATQPPTAERPSGVVTFLFTDLVGSTELLDQLGDDDADGLRRRHFALLRQTLGDHQGQEVKSLGDGLMAAFASPLAAIGCAVAIQEAVAAEALGAEAALAVRVGVHAGEPIAEYFGTPVVVAQRLCSRARGGQILASALVQGLVGNRGGHTFKGLGGLTLKGLAEPVAACEVAWGARPEVAVPLPLPLERDDTFTLIGRDQELTRLEAAWEAARNGRRRFLLLAGEPGIGKTRLAAEIARLAHRSGGTVLFGRCDERMGVPYQPVVEHLPAGGPGARPRPAGQRTDAPGAGDRRPPP